MKRQLTDAIWIAGGTSTTALGTLVGVRVLTQFLPPSAYGVLSLVLGMSTLAISLVATPLTQAAIHYYPTVVTSGSPRAILQSLLRCFLKMAPWIAVALAGMALYIYRSHASPLIAGLAVLLFVSDCWRSANLSLLNAARRHRRYVLWTFADTWSRPLIGAAAVFAVGPYPAAVLASYVLVSAALLLLFSRALWPRLDHASDGTSAAATSRLPSDLDAAMWSYALPLIPLGLIGWISNLGDRYIIAGTLSIADAGVYAAIYGLSSAPFMLVGGTVELALRPVHQAAVAAGNHEKAQAILHMWLAAVTVICASGVLILAFGHHLLAEFCVGRTYRHASSLMPWIGLGYAIRSVSYVFERVCYAYGQTRRVLTTQVCAVIATAVATPLGVFTAGLQGAAMAVPVYFSVQLATAVIQARRTMRQALSIGTGEVHGVAITRA